eukprot:jgi/Astpho2/5005/Aster-x1270
MQPQQQDLLQADDLHGMLHVRDSLGAESGFLQLTLIKQALQLHHRVILLLVQETLPHYHQAIRKLGVNLALASQQGHLVAVDLGHSLVASGGSPEAELDVQDVVSQLELHCEEAAEQTQQRGAHAFLFDHRDIEQDTVWQAFLDFRCSALIEVLPLDSGASAEVHGQPAVE